jgi:uncharacterized membrane protein
LWGDEVTGARLRVAFTAAAATWALLLVAAPFAASQPHASTITGVLTIGVYAAGSLLCHQLPERSYHLWAAQMPVCARCAGIYFGAAMAVLVAAAFRQPRASEFARHLPMPMRHSPAPARPAPTVVALRFSRASVRILLALAVLPSVLTLVSEWATGVMPAHAIRAAAGAPIGIVVAWLVVAATDNQVN